MIHRSIFRLAAVSSICVAGMIATPTVAEVTAFKQAVAETAALDDDLAAFYRANEFQSIWTGSDELAQSRRNALLSALSTVEMHGLPADRYDVSGMMARLQAAQTAYDQGAMEVELSRALISYASDVGRGLLNPSAVIDEIKRGRPEFDGAAVLAEFSQSNPVEFLRGLAPQSAEYARLMRAKLQLEAQIAAGGWGDVVASSNTLRPGDTGNAIVQLRNRLIRMGYLPRTMTAEYDGAMQAAVLQFQQKHGLNADGVAGPSTIEQVNVSARDRLESVIVAMERERWLGVDRGERHVWVNQADFTAQIIDNDIVTFETRSVIGALSSDRQSPEFSDVMEFMVINPSWYVPRSIIVNEYLPQLQANAGAVGHLQVIASNGQVVSRNQDFSQYTSSSFPYSMKQPPGPRNALGSVKFMFPNRYNIYLHDTPAQNLFSREVRAFSHGCIRLDDPHDFAYALLAVQTDDPVGYFQSRLRSGQETRVDLQTPVPVHLDYRTAYSNADGSMEYRRDVYGRDARIWSALQREGVEIASVSG
nr:L,D-transpeptidase family protein [Marivivens niveibacter]